MFTDRKLRLIISIRSAYIVLLVDKPCGREEMFVRSVGAGK